MKKHSNPEKNKTSLREKIIGLGERSIKKSYYPQLQEQLEKLKESERRFRELAELLPQVVFEMDGKGKLLFANHYAFEAFGYTQDDFDKGLNAFQMFIPEDKERVGKDILRVLNGEYVSGIEYNALRKDGSTFPVLAYASPVIRENKTVGVRGILVDITERKLSERELRRFNDLLRAIIEAAPVAIIGLDLDGNVRTVWNPAAEKMLGWSTQEVMGHPLPSVPVESQEEFRRFRERIRRGETMDGVEVCRQRRDGTPIDYSIYASPLCDAEGRIIGNIAILVDISERKRVENIMQARLRLLEFASSHSLDEFLTATVDEIEALTGSTIGFYHFLEPDQRTLSLQNWSTNALENMCTALGKGRHYDISEAGVWVDCVYECRPVIHNDYSSLSHRKGMPEGHVPLIREVVVPVFRGSLIKAIIGVGNKSTDYNESDIEIVSQLGDLSWDIVERKRSEETLLESEQRFRSIFDITGEGILLADPDDKKFYMGNKMICQMLGYEPEEIGNLSVRDIHPEEQLPYVLEQFEKQARREIMLASDIPVKRKDGNIFYADIRSSSIMLRGKTYVMGIFSDITERKLTEEALRDSAQQWQTTFDAMNECIFLLDSSFTILRCNKASYNILGKSPEELVGRKCWEAVHATSAPVDWCPVAHMQKTLKRESSITQMEKRWIEVYANPLLDSKGTLIGSVHVIADITERMKAEREIKKRIKELEEFYEIAVRRELRMKDLKEEIEELKKELAQYKKQ